MSNLYMQVDTAPVSQDWRNYGGSFWEWLIYFRDPAVNYKYHTSYLAYEFFFFFAALVTLVASFRQGGRVPFIWFGAIVHGFVLEMLCYYVPDVDNFWQSHSSVMFFGRRYPLHIFCLYAYFIPMGTSIARRLRLPWWSEPFAAGIYVVLTDLPMDILGVKLLWWTWHDTDPAIYDRFYWVPWTSFIFHATFTASFWCLFNGLHKIIAGGDRNEYRGFIKELIVTVLTGSLTSTCGVFCFLFVYHPLHDFHHIHSEVICVILVSFYALMIFKGDRRRETPLKKESGWFDLIALMPFLNSIFYMATVVLADPATISNEGYFETIGSCNTTFVVNTPVGPVTRSKYLCPTNFRSIDYFTWDCLPKTQKDALLKIGDGIGEPTSFYTICGTAYPNRSEYITIVWAACIFYALLSYEILRRSKPWVASNQKQTVAKGKGKSE